MQLVILIYHISGASAVSATLGVTSLEAPHIDVDLKAYMNFLCLPVHSGVHACAGASGSIPFPDWIWTLLLFLAQRRLWPV